MPYLGNIPAENYASFDKQTITGDGGTSYTLSNPVGSAQEVAIFVNNVRQEPGVAYTVAGTALTMTGNVSASDDFYAIFIGKAVQTVAIPEKATNGDYNFDGGTLFVDASTNRVGVGTTSPAYKIDIIGDTNGSTVGRIGNTNTGGSTQSILQIATGATYNRYVNLNTNYTSQYFQMSNSNIPTSYSDFNTQILRNSSGTEYARFDSDGLKFNGDTAAANALDDYEEGTFTPQLYHNSTNNSTFGSANGQYTKIGNTVTCQLRVDGGNSGTAGSFLVIGGLPFAVSQTQSNMGIGIWGSNPSQQVGNIHAFNPPRVFKGGTDITTQMTFFTAMLVYKTS